MLNIYDDLSFLPRDKRYIKDVEAWAVYPKTDSGEIDIILSEIEKGKFYSEEFFTDRFGGQLYWEFLSTGSKAALLTVLEPDYVVNMAEAGQNVLSCLVKNKMSGNVYIDSISRIIALPDYDIPVDLYYAGINFETINQLSTWRRYGHK